MPARLRSSKAVRGPRGPVDAAGCPYCAWVAGDLVSIIRRYSFEAAHKLDWHLGKCRSLHGHSYVLEVEVTGPVGEHGVVMDFAELDTVVEECVVSRLDHTYLNDLLDNPTAELVASAVGGWLDEAAIGWSVLRLWETERGSVVVRRTG